MTSLCWCSAGLRAPRAQSLCTGALGLEGGRELALSPDFQAGAEAASAPDTGLGAGRGPMGEQGAEKAWAEKAHSVAASSYVWLGDGPSCPSRLSSAPSSSPLLSVSMTVEPSAWITRGFSTVSLGVIGRFSDLTFHDGGTVSLYNDRVAYYSSL